MPIFGVTPFDIIAANVVSGSDEVLLALDWHRPFDVMVTQWVFDELGSFWLQIGNTLQLVLGIKRVAGSSR